MSSRQTAALVTYVTNSAYKLRLFHFHCKVVPDSEAGFRVLTFYETRRHCWERLAVVCAHVSFRGWLASYGIWYDFNTLGLGPAESLTFYVVVLLDSMSTFILLAINLFGSVFSDLSETFLSLEYRLRKIHKLKGGKPDGAERTLKGMHIMMGSTIACVPFINWQLVQREIHVFGVMKTDYGAGAGCFALGGGYLLFSSWVLVALFVQGALVYVNSTLRWLKMLRWGGPDMPSEKKDGMLFAYRMHQAMHIFATQSSSAIIAIALTLDALIMITILVLLIGFQAKLNPALIFAFGVVFIVSTFATKLLLGLGTYITGCSADFVESFQKNDTKLNLTQKRALRACPPLTLKIGPFSTISNETFPFLMSEIVVAQVVDILVGLKEVQV